GRRVTVGSVILQEIVFDGMNLGELLGRGFRGCATDALTDHSGLDGQSQGLAELLSGGDGLRRHAVQFAALCFENDQDAHRTRASNFNFSTSLAAEVFGSPSKIWVCLFLCGM